MNSAVLLPLDQWKRQYVERTVRRAHGPQSRRHESRADFIAMTTRGAGGVKRMVLGSVAEQVGRDSEIPVLLVTPND